MIFRRFLDVYQCSDLLRLMCLLWCFGGGGWRYRCVASILLDMIWGWYGTLFVMFFHMFIDAWISHCEMIAFMCGDMVRASVWSVVMCLVCWPAICFVGFGLPGIGFVWSGPSVLIDGSWSRLSGGFCLCSSVGVSTVLVRSSWYTWAGLNSFALFCFAQVWSVRFGLHWFGRGCSAPGRLVLVELGLVLFALVCSGVAHSALL